MYHRLPIGAVAAGGGIVATGGIPTGMEIGVAFLVSSVLLAGVTVIRRIRRSRRR